MKNKVLKKLILPILICIGGFMYGQTVTGIVSDGSGPLPGVSVNVKGTLVGTETDFDGRYSITAAQEAVLVFRSLGYKTLEVTVSSNTVNVTLTEDATQLDEIVVVGYGSSAKKEITSAVTQVSEKEFNQGVINAPSQLLQGKVAGLSIYNRGGNPNEDAVIRIRGLSTVGSNQSPLIVVDGVIGASLDNIDPNDIASMTVLKDGSAAAIYGSRGSSGVIIVTTKKGRLGKTQISYSGQVSAASIARRIENMTADEFVAAGGSSLGNSTDWLKEVTRSAVSNIHNIALSGGYDDTSFRASVNFRDSQGILQKSGFKQLNSRASFKTTTLNDKLTISLNTSYTKRDSDFSFNEALRYATLYNPTAPIYHADSNVIYPFPYAPENFAGYFESLGAFDSFNPVSIINQNSNTGERSEFIYSANINYSVTDDINVNALYSQQSKVFTTSEYYAPRSHFRGGATDLSGKGLARINTGRDKFKLFEIYADYSQNFSKDFYLKVTGGYSWQQINSDNYFLSTGGFPDSSISYINALEWSADVINNLGRIKLDSNKSPDEKIIAFFARANATLYDGIYLNASIRREGSTKLGVNNRWGYFPAAGLGVDLNKYLDLNNTDIFKIRLGYGTTGSLPSENGLHLDGWIPIDNKLKGEKFRAANPDLRWEQKAETNIGIEYAGGSFSGTLDLYTRKVTDFILSVNVDSAVFGANTQVQNIGDLSTKGFELSLNYDVLKKEDLSFTTGFVLSSYKTVLDKYPGGEIGQLLGNLGAPGQNGTDMILVKEGEEIGQIYGAVFTGEVVNGSQVLADLNGDGVEQTSQIIENINGGGDLTKLGKGIPDFELGWRNQIVYKDWDFNIFFRGAFGHSLVNSFRAFYEPRVGTQGSINYINTSLANPDIKNAQFSSLYVEKADFVKLDNLSIGYNLNLPKDNKYFESIRLSLAGQNLFTITNYTGSDPEPSLSDRGPTDNGGFLSSDPANPLIAGIDRRNNYFLARTITLGVNINF